MNIVTITLFFVLVSGASDACSYWAAYADGKREGKSVSWNWGKFAERFVGGIRNGLSAGVGYELLMRMLDT